MTQDAAAIPAVIAGLAELKEIVAAGFSAGRKDAAALESALAALEEKIARRDGEAAAASAAGAALAALRERFDSQPDLRLLGHQMQAVVARVGALEDKSARALAALNDIARESATAGEAEALREELKEMRETGFNLDVRLRRMEEALRLSP